MTDTKTKAGLTAEEKAALKETMQERKQAARRGPKARELGEKDVMAKIAEMSDPDQSMARKFHDIVKAAAPSLTPRTWYGMPAYANEDGKIVCFFSPAAKFKVRYSSIGFEESAKLDDGNMWPTGFALNKLTSAEEKRIADLVKKAAS